MERDHPEDWIGAVQAGVGFTENGVPWLADLGQEEAVQRCVIETVAMVAVHGTAGGLCEFFFFGVSCISIGSEAAVAHAMGAGVD